MITDEQLAGDLNIVYQWDDDLLVISLTDEPSQFRETGEDVEVGDRTATVHRSHGIGRICWSCPNGESEVVGDGLEEDTLTDIAAAIDCP